MFGSNKALVACFGDRKAAIKIWRADIFSNGDRDRDRDRDRDWDRDRDLAKQDPSFEAFCAKIGYSILQMDR